MTHHCIDAPDDRAERQHRSRQRAHFAAREAKEMYLLRILLWRNALCWGLAIALPAALLAWGLDYGIATAARAVDISWHSPGPLLCILIGALAGTVGGATAAVLRRTVFEEDPDFPLVVCGAATTCMIIAAIHGAGRGGAVRMAVEFALAVPVGIGVGLLAYTVYWGLKWLWLAARASLVGY